MTGRWAGSTRRTRLPPTWPQLRTATKARAGGRCEWPRVLAVLPELAVWAARRGRDLDPPRHSGSDADHIRRGDDHRPGNLAWICAGHHATKSAWEGGVARPRETRPRERHPGLT